MRIPSPLLLAPLVVALCSACSDTEDPAARPDTGASDTGGSDSGGTDTGGTDATPTDDTSTPPDGTDPTTDTGGPGPDGDTGPVDPGDTDGGIDPTPDTTPTDGGQPIPDVEGDTGPVEFVCGQGVRFSGQVFGRDVPNGGVPVFVDRLDEIAYADAGLAAVRAAAPTTRGATNSDLSLQVTSATVIATSFRTDGDVSRSSTVFWVEDASGSMAVRLSPFTADVAPLFDVRVGQQISFTVTEITNFNGTIQIQKAESWTLDESDTEVYILDRTGETLASEEAGRMVRVTGTMASGGENCGGQSLCWNIEHGEGTPLELRIRDNYTIAPGQCVSIVGPLGFFGEKAQVNAENFDWVFRYRLAE
jgi:hypothetical protein